MKKVQWHKAFIALENGNNETKHRKGIICEGLGISKNWDNTGYNITQNEVCGTCGVEALWCENFSNTEPIATYLNTGETYTTTIIYREDIVKRWDIISMGDLVEVYERKGMIIR